MYNPYQPTEDLEKALVDYTNAPYVVCVNSCTNALLLACAWHKNINEWINTPIEIPKRTYVGVPQSILNAGYPVKFMDRAWVGEYRLFPLNVWDSARLFTSNMYRPGDMQCVSFHVSKTLGIEAGGAILTDNEAAAQWFRQARHDGRTPGVSIDEDHPTRGWHCLMNPSSAAIGLLKLHSLPKHNNPLPNDDYPDLSLMEVFK